MEGFRAQAGEVLGERYRLVRVLGEGGMGEVWEAVHLVLDRHVAVKILKPRFAQQAEVLLRFRREAQVTAGLGHPKIVEILDFVWGPGQPTYLVMELLQGRSLEQALRERGCLAWPVALRVAVDVLDALGAAHAAGVVHRDMKPANIWLEGDLNEPRVKVLDFGVAQIADEGGPKLTRTNATVGTPQYLPPEQIAGSRVDGRADLWAVGVSLYETLAGRPPFVGGDFAAMVGAVLTQEPPSLVSLVPEVPPRLAEAVSAALRKDPAQRPPNAEAMAAPLRELLKTVARQHGEDAFASTMELTSPPQSAGAASADPDAAIAVPSSAQRPGGVPALDSSPRLPGTRVHRPAASADARVAKKRKFGHAVVLSPAELPQVSPLSLGGAADPALLGLDEDEPPVLPAHSTGKWLLGAVVVALFAGGALFLVALLGGQPHEPSASADATPTASTPSFEAAAALDAGAAPGAQPSVDTQPPAQDASAGPSTRVLPAQAPEVEPSALAAAPNALPAGRAPEARVTSPEPTPATMQAVSPEPAPATMQVVSPEPAPATTRPTSATPRAAPTAAPRAQTPARAGDPGEPATHLRRVSIGGSYDRAAAQVYVGAAEAAADRCVARTHPPTGTTTYRVEIPADGHVEHVTGGEVGVRRCLTRAFSFIQWRPPSGGAQSLTLTYEALP